MKIRYLFYIAALLTSVLAHSEERTMVLVTAKNSNIQNLSLRDVRKLYLGVPFSIDGVALRPLRNLEESLLEEIFLQKIVFMSQSHYEYQLLSRVFRLGGLRPLSYDRKEDLKQALVSSSNAVSYMWEKDLMEDDSLKKIEVLWAGSID